VLNRLIFCQDINNIDYRVYYFSCNLEHVLHDNPNVKDENKSKKAEELKKGSIIESRNFWSLSKVMNSPLQETMKKPGILLEKIIIL